MKPVLEKIPLGNHQTISAFRYAKPKFETPWHFHPQHELTYIDDSIGTKFIGDYVGSYEPGELVLLRSNLPHCWKNQTSADRLSQSTVIQWNKGIFAPVPELEALFSMLKKASRGVLFVPEEVAPLIPRIQALPLLPAPALYTELLTILLALANCKQQTLSTASFTQDLPSAYNSRMAQIHDFVEANFHRKIYLKEMATLVNMSEQSFSRFFKKMMGRPFFTFLNEYRINIASRLLIDTDQSVAEIGYSCGYESLPFFHKQFNKFKGSSPSRYRRRYWVE